MVNERLDRDTTMSCPQWDPDVNVVPQHGVIDLDSLRAMTDPMTPSRLPAEPRGVDAPPPRRSSPTSSRCPRKPERLHSADGAARARAVPRRAGGLRDGSGLGPRPTGGG